jgi:hypothetical protein
MSVGDLDGGDDAAAAAAAEGGERPAVEQRQVARGVNGRGLDAGDAQGSDGVLEFLVELFEPILPEARLSRPTTSSGQPGR